MSRWGATLTKEDLLADFDRVTYILGHYPTTAEYDDLGMHGRPTFRKHFDSWQAVKDACRDRHLKRNRLEGEALREAGRKGGEATARKHFENAGARES